MEIPLKTILFSLFVIALFAEGDSKKTSTVDDNISWEDYKKQFGKSYKSPADENAHKQAFLENQKFVIAHNAKHSRGEKSYHVGINHLSDLLQHEKDRMRGHRSRHHQNTRNRRQASLTCSPFAADSTVAIPDSIDWRTKGAVTDVKDQGQCGSCWTFSTTGALEGQLFQKTKKLVSLSEQNLVDCDKTDGGCDGGNADVAFAFINSNGGIDTEDSYPYSANTQKNGVAGTCAFNQATVAGTIVGCVQIPKGDETALKAAVATIGPISIAVNANSTEFLSFASSDTLDDALCSNNQETDHAILIVGYGTDSAGKDFWIVKNSWSTSWGNGGYMNMVRGKNCIGIANDAFYPTV